RSVFSRGRSSFFIVNRLVCVFGGLGGDNLQDGATNSADGQCSQDVATRYGVLAHLSSPCGRIVEFVAGISRLQITFLGLVQKMLRRAPGKGHDRQRGILVWVGDKRRS